MTTNDRKKKGIEPDEQHRSCGLVSFGADVRKLIGPLLGKKGLLQADILRYWPEILGEELTAGVTPDSVSFSKKTAGAILTVKAFSGAFAVEFSSRKEQIRERLNAYFGYEAVSDIRIKQGGTFTPPPPKEEPPDITEKQSEEINDLVSGIESESLRDAVSRLCLLLKTSKKD